ncbi:MAG: hypothetical protein ABH852_05025 [Methanobacteriota archaeon]
MGQELGDNPQEVNPMRCPNYWKAYHASKLYDKREVFKLCSRVARRLGSLWKVSRRGRPPKFHPTEHTAVCIYRKCSCPTFRYAEGDTALLLDTRIDHVTIWWAFQRIPVIYFERALELLYELISKLFKCEIFVTDSTGVETDRYRKRRKGLKTVQEHEFGCEHGGWMVLKRKRQASRAYSRLLKETLGGYIKNYQAESGSFPTPCVICKRFGISWDYALTALGDGNANNTTEPLISQHGRKIDEPIDGIDVVQGLLALHEKVLRSDLMRTKLTEKSAE